MKQITDQAFEKAMAIVSAAAERIAPEAVAPYSPWEAVLVCALMKLGGCCGQCRERVLGSVAEWSDEMEDEASAAFLDDDDECEDAEVRH